MPKNWLGSLHRDQSGQTFIEFALLIVLVVLTSATYFTPLGQTIGNKVGEMTSKIASVGS